MKNTKPLYLTISMIALIFIISGCTSGEGIKKINPDLILDANEETVTDSVIDELTPIISIGDDVSVPVYKCSTDTDCNRCQDGDVYSQDCENGICQGTLELVEDRKDECSGGGCIDKGEFTAKETTGSIGEDYDVIEDDSAIVDNDDFLSEETQCSNSIKDCIGYRGIGSIYLSKYPECKCKFIYVPAGCNPNELPCPDYSPRSNYPDCSCNK